MDVIVDVAEEEPKKFAQGQVAENSEGSWSFDSPWESSGDESQTE